MDLVQESEGYRSINVLINFPPCIFTHVLMTSLNGSHALFRLIAKYRPTMPVLSVVIPRLKTDQLKWSFSGAFEVRYLDLNSCLMIIIIIIRSQMTKLLLNGLRVSGLATLVDPPHYIHLWRVVLIKLQFLRKNSFLVL